MAEVFRCPKCKEFINTNMRECRFCGSPVDPSAAEASVEVQAKTSGVSNDASLAATVAGAMVVTLALGLILPTAKYAFYILFLVVPCLVIRTRWRMRTIKKLEPGTVQRAQRSLKIAMATWILTFAVLAAIGIGVVIGNRRTQTALARLSDQISKLGTTSAPVKQKFIALTRRETPTMESYVQRCSELEPVNAQYRSLLEQMDSLLGQIQPRLRGDPATFASVSTLKSVAGKDLEVTALVEKEVTLAKKLPLLSPAERPRYYQNEIQPVREQELRVGTEEIALVNAAKARGVRLPDQMFAAAGVQ